MREERSLLEEAEGERERREMAASISTSFSFSISISIMLMVSRAGALLEEDCLQVSPPIQT